MNTVPVYLDNVFGGLADCHGLLRDEGDHLVLEYQSQDPLLGVLKSDVKHVEIPRDLLVSVTLKTSWLGLRSSLLVQVSRMDLVAGVKKVVVVMEHSAKDEPKLLKRCNLPLTGAGVVDMVITDLGVFTIDKKAGGMTLTELAPGVTVDEITKKTEATFKADPKLKR